MKLITAKRGKDGQWYIGFRNAGNHRGIGDGGEGYASKGKAVRAMHKNWDDGYRLELIRETRTAITFRMRPMPVRWNAQGEPVGNVGDEQLMVVLQDALRRISERSGLPL